MVQENLCSSPAGPLAHYLLVLPQGEDLVEDQVGQHGVDVQLAEDLLPVLLEDLGGPPLLPPGAGPPASFLRLLPLLLPGEPLLGAAAEHLQVEETHQNFFRGSVNAVPEGEEAHISYQRRDHARYLLRASLFVVV